MLEKTKEAIKNGQSRNIGNVGHTSNRTKTNETHTTTFSNLCTPYFRVAKYDTRVAIVL
jgi:hypothetical protein